MSELDDILELPEDPELAFVIYEKRRRQEMWKAINDQEVSRSYEQDQKIYYATKILAFHDAHNFKLFDRPDLIRESSSFDRTFDQFVDTINYWTTQIEIRHAQRLRSIATILRLTPEIRLQLHSYIAKIRETVLPMDLARQKKEAILGKLNALADEIDRDRTKTEAWTALTLEITSAGGQAARELMPVRELADAIGNLLGKAKAIAEDMLGLPSPMSPKRIEGPPKRLSPPASERPPGELDDDVSF